jgi:hypothetical protein
MEAAGRKIVNAILSVVPDCNRRRDVGNVTDAHTLCADFIAVPSDSFLVRTVAQQIEVSLPEGASHVRNTPAVVQTGNPVRRARAARSLICGDDESSSAGEPADLFVQGCVVLLCCRRLLPGGGGIGVDHLDRLSRHVLHPC